MSDSANPRRLPTKLAKPAARSADVDPNYQKFAVAPARLTSAPDLDVRPPLPIRRSGSPLRRKQIHDLENLPEKRQRIAHFASEVPAATSARDTSTLEQMAESIERIANTFTATATSMRDSKVFQQDIMEEISLLKVAVAQLQKDVLTLLERSK